MFKYQYSLINCEHLPEKLVEDAQEALRIRAYVCQQEFERALDMYHEINLFDLPETSGEAKVVKIEIEDNTVYVTLDCQNIEYER